jgi:hypothetical protein
MYHLGEEEGPFQAHFHRAIVSLHCNNFNYLDGTDLPEKLR